MALLHAIQGIVILIIAAPKSFPITTNFLTTDSLSTQAAGRSVLGQATKHIFDVRILYLIVAFFFISAVAHLLIATVYRNQYEEDLKKGINKLRWIDYGFSAGTMLVAIGLVSGISDLSTLLSVFALTMLMNLIGLATEIHNQATRRTNWLGYWAGYLSGIVPWVVILVYLLGSSVYGSTSVPASVLWIYITIFILFNCSALNTYLQYKKKSKWADYLYSERTYMIISLIAKTALAWQIFAGVLHS